MIRRFVNLLLRLWASDRAAVVGPERFMDIETGGCMAETVRSIRRGTVVRHAINTGTELRFYPKGTPCILLRYDDHALYGKDIWAPLVAYQLDNPADVLILAPMHKDVMEPGVLTRFV